MRGDGLVLVIRREPEVLVACEPILHIIYSRLTLGRQHVPTHTGHGLGQLLEVQDVKGLLVTVLTVVAHADVGALGDDGSELGRVCIYTCAVGQIHEVVVGSVELIGQMLCECVGAAAPIPLVCDHAVNTPAVERNGPVELGKQQGVMLSKVCRTDAALLLALCEHVVTRHVLVDHVHEHRAASTIVCTEGRTVSVPVCVGLANLVGRDFTVHRVNVGNEQCAVLGA